LREAGTLHSAVSGKPSATPAAPAPRKDGQFPSAEATRAGVRAARANPRSTPAAAYVRIVEVILAGFYTKAVPAPPGAGGCGAGGCRLCVP